MRNYHNDESLPIFEEDKKERYTPMEAMEILTDKSIDDVPKCTKVPLRVRANRTFLMDTTKFKQWEDIKSDMNGSYPYVLRTSTWTVNIDEYPPSQVQYNIISRKSEELKYDGQYHLKFNSKKNHAGLCRSIILLLGQSGAVLNNVCLLQYHISTGEDTVEFEVKSHGSSKEKKPFFPCEKSVLNTIKERVAKQPASTVYEDVKKEAGGPSKAKNIGQLPRSRQQVYHLSHLHKAAIDPIDELLKYAKETEEKIVISHHDLPEDLWILGTDQMSKDLYRFSTSELLSYPLSVDPTFSFGKYEVTPFCYRHLFLKSKRTQVPPVFIGPTALHHSKTKATFKKIVGEVTSASPDLANKAKSFITDGELPLHESLEECLKHAKGLRCFVHFKRNCIDKLSELGIKEKKQQEFFLQTVFGKQDKEEGILDAWGKRDLRARLDSVKDDLDKKEREVLKKGDNYESQFWVYLNKNSVMFGRNMIAKARAKAGLPLDEHGKPKRCYTHQSESLNNILTRRKEAFIKNYKGKQDLSKLQFATEIFQPTYKHQMEELQAAIYGGSDEYELADICKYLQVSPETWFGEWSESKREGYVNKFNELTVEHVLEEKPIRLPNNDDLMANYEPDKEFVSIPNIVEEQLKEKRGYSDELIKGLIEQVSVLVNSTNAIQRQPNLDATAKAKFLVASKTAKSGYNTCTKNERHISCACNSYKHDSVCKHSLAVAIQQKCLQSHLQHIKQSNQRSRCGLVQPVNDNCAGKKGGKNKNRWRASRSREPQETQFAAAGFNPAVHHNDKPFIITFLDDNPKATECRTCRTGFIRRTKIIPFDIVLAHEERWMYPDQRDKTKWLPSAKTTTKYYCVRKSCIMERFPYFNASFLVIPPEKKASLLRSHLNLLDKEFNYKP